MEHYSYRYVEGLVLTSWTARDILDAIRNNVSKFEVVADLGLRRATVEYRDGKIFVEGYIIDIEILKSFKEGFVYKLLEGSIHRLDMYSEGRYYKLRAVAPDKAPTIEISGIHMHRIYGVDPWSDSLAKVRSIGRKIRGARVLDICTGLGYTAIAEVLLGAESVTSIEVDKNVLHLASMNPWSRDLENPRIEIVLGDAYKVLDYLETEGYDVVVHDPPRFEIAGELYSLEFYRKVYNVLRRGGILIHYTGSPGKHSNIDILKGVKSRLTKAGFEDIRWLEEIQGFKAYKRV